jgi:hypothetical protein
MLPRDAFDDRARAVKEYSQSAEDILTKHLESFIENFLQILVLASDVMAGRGLAETYDTSAEIKKQMAPSRRLIYGLAHRSVDEWLGQFDEFLRGRGRPPKPLTEKQAKKREYLHKEVLRAIRTLGHNATAEKIAIFLQLGSGKPESRARVLRRELAKVNLKLEDLRKGRPTKGLSKRTRK